MEVDLCRCGSGVKYRDCCKPYHQLQAIAKTPEALMRSRYCAYVLHLANYLVATTHLSQRHLQSKDAILTWAKANTWLKLEVCKVEKEEVEFKAYYMHQNKLYVHHENSTFLMEKGKWYYLYGEHFED